MPTGAAAGVAQDTPPVEDVIGVRHALDVDAPAPPAEPKSDPAVRRNVLDVPYMGAASMPPVGVNDPTVVTHTTEEPFWAEPLRRMGQSMFSHVNYQFRNRARGVARSDLHPMMLEVEQRRSTLHYKPDRSEQEEQDLAIYTDSL